MDLPEGYEMIQINTTDGTDTCTILARRPDGGVSSIWRKMNRKAVSGVCPACGRQMKEHQPGHMSCANGHGLIVMTDSRATSAHLGKHTQRKQKRTYTMRKPKAFPPLKKQTATEKANEVAQSFADEITQALGDYL